MERTIALEYPQAQTFVDEPDEAVVVKIDDICFGVFRGTLITSNADIAQNLNPGVADDVCYSGSCCPTRQGYRDAFLDVEYYNDFENAIRGCSRSCCRGTNCSEGTKCEVVFTGFSQGGSAAQVASVILRDLDPTTITFGQPPTMEAPCTALDTSKYYRFINTVNSGTNLRYDAAPFVEFAGARQSGVAFVLGENTGAIPSYEDFEAPDIAFPFWFPNFLQVHDMVPYTNRLIELLNQGAFPVPVDGFDTGHPCTLDSECQSTDLCNVGICTRQGGGFETPVRGQVGDPCFSDFDCLPTNTCEGLINRSCRARSPVGSVCNENGDCLSNQCVLTAVGRACVGTDPPPPTPRPTSPPVLATPAPFAPPTLPPTSPNATLAPILVPTVPPTDAPVPAPTQVPVAVTAAPTQAPVAPKTVVPVPSPTARPTRAPVPPPTQAPISSTSAPVQAIRPTTAPVADTTTAAPVADATTAAPNMAASDAPIDMTTTTDNLDRGETVVDQLVNGDDDSSAATNIVQASLLTLLWMSTSAVIFLSA